MNYIRFKYKHWLNKIKPIINYFGNINKINGINIEKLDVILDKLKDILLNDLDDKYYLLHGDCQFSNILYDEKDIFTEGKLYKPTSFFKRNYAWYWKTDNHLLKGKIKYEWQDKTEQPYDFEFDIEYEKGHWYPLTDGILQDKHKQKIISKNKNKFWTGFPENTPLGMRGPIIIWNEIKDMEKVYYS